MEAAGFHIHMAAFIEVILQVRKILLRNSADKNNYFNTRASSLVYCEMVGPNRWCQMNKLLVK